MRRKGPAARLVVLYAAAFTLASIVLIADAPPQSNRFLAELYHLRHVLFFGFGGLIVLELTALVGRRWIRKRSLYYLVAAFSVVLMSLGLEIIYPGASGFDGERFSRNVFGSIALLALSGALDRPLRREHDWLRGRPRRLVGWGAVVVILIVMQSLIPIAVSYAGRSGAYPRVVDMTDPWQQRFIEPRDALLFVGMPPEGWTSRNNRVTAMILFGPSPGSGVMIHEPYLDWTGYNTLQVQVFSLLKDSRRIVLRVEDKRSEHPVGDRTDLPLTVAPGYNLYEIPLEQIRNGPRGRKLRLNKIRRVGVFSTGSAESYMLFFSDFRLVDRPRPESPSG